MKFMKLGSRPDTFCNTGDVRSISSEVSSDLVIQVKGTKYLLHKFPLLSKCLRLQKLCSETIELPDFPGSTEAFELCAKFCYGITITISCYNIIPALCAAEYLQMTENVEKGNLIHKLDVFFNSCILNGFKDSIVTLQSTKLFRSWSEESGITNKCIEAIASKVASNPLTVSYSRRGRDKDEISCKGWWAEDLSDLGIDLYWRTMVAIKSQGQIPTNLIGNALKIYASKWLPNISRNLEMGLDFNGDFVNSNSKSKLLLESIISLLPIERKAVSCSFLLKLLKACNILRASSSLKMELAKRVGLQLDEATVSDLLIPSLSNETVHDVDLILTILEQFMLQNQSQPTSPVRVKEGFEKHRRSKSMDNGDFDFHESMKSSSVTHSSKIKVAKLVDRYLQEIASDVNLPLSKFTALTEAIPDFARLDHDHLYRAIDIYLKTHPNLNKSERKRLCRTLDCKKLSPESCIHAAQNELLPLRVVVQVLFFDQARAAMAGGKLPELPGNIKALLAAQDNATRAPKSDLSILSTKLAENDEKFGDGIVKNESPKIEQLCSNPNRPKRMFGKLWSNNKNANEKA